MAQSKSTKDKSAAPANLEQEMESLTTRLRLARDEIHNVVFGQHDVVMQTMTTLLSGGHALLMGVPGLAKTKLVETVATVFGLDTKRVQCTPDLMPADILGVEILDEDEKGKRHFRFIQGPVFTQLLMADEINRASPRTQSALLQAMQEYIVSVAGHNHALPTPFHVLATQNPLEQEGTYPLPEAQLDRFLMQINVDYPDKDTERRILIETTGSQSHTLQTVFDAETLIKAQKLIRDIPVGEKVVDAILNLIRRGRPDISDIKSVRDHVEWAPGPRAGQALMLASRARALLDGRYSPSVDDVLDLAHPVLRHRMALHFTARADHITLDDIISDMCKDL